MARPHVKCRLFLFVITVLAVSFGYSQTAKADDSLPSWNDGSSKKSIVEFVKKVTTEGGPDLIGYGKSDKPKELEHYKAENVEKDLLSLIDKLGLKDINIIGHDWGAVIDWDLVSFRPELFKRHVAMAVGHPIPAFGQLSTDDIAVNWYMFLDALDSAPDLYLLNDCQFHRKYIMPEHPEIDEVCEWFKGPGAMQGNCNWDKANPMTDAYIAVLSGELEKTVSESQGAHHGYLEHR